MTLGTIYEETLFEGEKKIVRRLYENRRCILRISITESTKNRAVCVDRLATIEDHMRATKLLLDSITSTLRH